MNIKTRVVKLEKLSNITITREVLLKHGLPLAFIESDQSEEEKETIKQNSWTDHVNKIAKEFNITSDKAEQQLIKNNIPFLIMCSTYD